MACRRSSASKCSLHFPPLLTNQANDTTNCALCQIGLRDSAH
jgi:hypothetical protein